MKKIALYAHMNKSCHTYPDLRIKGAVGRTCWPKIRWRRRTEVVGEWLMSTLGSS